MGFRPLQTTKNIVVGTAGTDRLALDFSAGISNTVRIFNSHATAVVFCRFGDVTITCDFTTNGIPVGPLSYQDFEPPVDSTHVAFDSAAGGITVYTTEGMSND